VVVVALHLPSAQATTELDRLYTLETVGFLKSWDNVDGMFADYVSHTYRDYFARQSRFVLQDLSKGNEILTKAKIPYHRVIEDADILGQLARSTRTQSIIRTKIQKEGNQYRFNLDWLHSPRMDVMASDSFVLRDEGGDRPRGLEWIRSELELSLDRMIAKVPFQGHVTGRDNESITINLGENANLKKGDTIAIGTLDAVKKHPLTKSIVEWRLTPTGKAEIQSVDEKIAFAKVLEEEEGKPVSRYQKVMQILPKPEAPTPEIIDEAKEAAKALQEPPKVGWVRGGLNVGGFSRQYSGYTSSSTQDTASGSAFSTGVSAEGELWFTRHWFTNLEFAYGFYTYSQTLVSGGPDFEDTAGNYTLFKGDVGYSYLITEDFFGPKGWVKLGYRSTSYSLPYERTQLIGSVSIGSLFLGVGGQLPLRDDIGLLLNFDFGVLPSATETNIVTGSGSGQSVTDIAFFLGGYYHFSPRMSVRAGLDVLSHSATFAGTGGRSASLSQKVITFAPSLIYYF
jgi:hypothetical protein